MSAATHASLERDAHDNTEIPSKMHGEVILRRGAVMVSKLVIPTGITLQDHPASDDILAIGIRGTGTFYVEREPRRIGPGEVIDLHAGENYSIDADDELEIVFIQGH